MNQPAHTPAPEPAADPRARAEVMRLKGLDLDERGEYEQALVCYHEAVAADPSYAEAHNDLGMVLIELGRYDEAAAALQESIRLDPVYADAHNNLGFVLRRLGREFEAAQAYTRYLELNPDDTDAPRIRKWLEIKAPGPPEAPAPPPPPLPADGRAMAPLPPLPPLPADGRKTKVVSLAPGVQMEFVLLPAGLYQMGGAVGCAEWVGDEMPPHPVRITRPFWLGKCPVTVAEWNAVLSNAPRRGSERGAVHMVSWNDCQEFMAEAAARGIALRLPTEAEWEYACRAGTVTAYPWGDDAPVEYAWTMEIYGASRQAPGFGVLIAGGDEPPDVGRKQPNPWDLYDMCGLVWEWCADWYAICYEPDPVDDPKGPAEGEYRAVRGGSISAPLTRAYAGARESWRPDSRLPHVGFRCAMDADPEEPAQPETVESLLHYAEQLRTNACTGTADWFCERALKRLEADPAPDPAGTARQLGLIAAAYDNLGNRERSEELYRRAVAALDAAAPDSPAIAGLLSELGNLLLRTGNHDGAETVLQRALAIAEKADPGGKEAAAALNNLAMARQNKGDFDAAIPLFKRALEISEKALGPDHVQTFVCFTTLGNALAAKGDYGSAEPFLRRELDLLTRVLGADHEQTISALNDLTDALVKKGDLDAAEQLVRNLLARQEGALGSTNPKLADTLLKLANIVKAKGDHEGAVVLAWRARQLREKG